MWQKEVATLHRLFADTAADTADDTADALLTESSRIVTMEAEGATQLLAASPIPGIMLQPNLRLRLAKCVSTPARSVPRR